MNINYKELIYALGMLICIGVVLFSVAGPLFKPTTHQPIVYDTPSVPNENQTPADPKVEAFQFALEEAVRVEIGQPIEGYEPAMFMQVFPGLLPEDFDGVEAQIGVYVYENGELRHELGDVDLVHSAAQAISEEGLETLLENVSERLAFTENEVTVGEIIEELRGEEVVEPIQPDMPVTDPDPVACTMDAKMCPDGSFVGRTGPNCEFAACPSEPTVVYCEPQDEPVFCPDIYQPVCGLVQVQCITTPCDPVPETFSNGCYACGQGNVISYTDGMCAE